jgi:manganese oxidase
MHKCLRITAFLFLLLASSLQAQAPAPPRIRTYYIAAEPIDWNYTPEPQYKSKLTIKGDRDIPAVPEVALTSWLKLVYREYTDATFQTRVPVKPEWEHLGILGPLIRAEVGDIVKVNFRNNTSAILTMHPHGLGYDKESEGAYYFRDGIEPSAKSAGDAVWPGKSFTYTWTVPERAGPGPGDGSSVLWMYHSHYIESRDMNAGLMGPIIVTRKGAARPDGSPKDVDREFVVAFAVFDESASPLFMRNVVARGRTPNSVIQDANFHKALLFYTLNGLSYGNLPMLTMKKGEHVRWYMLSNSNEDDVHTPHWHGQTVISNMMRTDTISLGPMMMMVADMIPDEVGTWLFHCHVNDHLDNGMVGRFTVTP